MPVPLRDDESQAHLLAFGARVRQLRRARKLSQEQLAHAAGLHRTIVGFIERGERKIGASKVWPLAAALSVPASDLYTES